MSANGKPAEPSMDDILASIRRIIAEEPKPGTAPAARASDPTPARAPATVPVAVAAPTPVEPQRPSQWGTLGATPAPASPTAPSATGVASLTAAPPVPAVAKPAAGNFGDDLASLIGAVRASASLGGAPAPAAPPGPLSAPAPAAVAAPAPPSPNPAMPSPATPDAPSAGAAPSRPVSAPAPELQSPVAGTSTPRPPLVAGAAVAADEARSRGIEAALGGRPLVAQKPAEPVDAPVAAASVADQRPEAKDENVGESLKPASTAAGVTLAEAAAPVPSVNVPPTSATRPAVVVSPGGASRATARTMEDTVAEMLRPMLRDWLDENMPTIVEKAMKAELAEREQRKSGQKPN
ncbi:MAG: DUF2497 domain-containing protein [Hyphomicrobiaceae bacterium]